VGKALSFSIGEEGQSKPYLQHSGSENARKSDFTRGNVKQGGIKGKKKVVIGQKGAK